jgi:hypothetical protein
LCYSYTCTTHGLEYSKKIEIILIGIDLGIDILGLIYAYFYGSPSNNFQPVEGLNPIQRWNNKLRATSRYIGRWASHTIGFLRKEKILLSTIIDELEALVEVRPLTTQEIELTSQPNAQLANLLPEEELK